MSLICRPESSSGCLSPLRWLGLAFRLAALKKKTYSVIKHRAMALRAQGAHRGSAGCRRLPRRPYEACTQNGICGSRPAFCPAWLSAQFKAMLCVNTDPRVSQRSRHRGSGGSVPLVLRISASGASCVGVVCVCEGPCMPSSRLDSLELCERSYVNAEQRSRKDCHNCG